MNDAGRYGGSSFDAASTLPLDGGLGRPRRLAALLTHAVQRPESVAALISTLSRTRSERVYLSDSAAGRALRAYFDRRFLGVFPQNRLCRGVLVLPPDHACYLRGRRRQALRTNLRRAAAAGIECELITDSSRALAAAQEILANRHASITADDRANLAHHWPAWFERSHMTLLLARDPEGHPLAVLAAVVDDMVCLILVAVASSHDARWALHDHLVRVLIERGVRYLLAEGDGPFGAIGFPPGMRHYQRLLGYELRHVIPHSDARPFSGRAAPSYELLPAPPSRCRRARDSAFFSAHERTQ